MYPTQFHESLAEGFRLIAELERQRRRVLARHVDDFDCLSESDRLAYSALDDGQVTLNNMAYVAEALETLGG